MLAKMSARAVYAAAFLLCQLTCILPYGAGGGATSGVSNGHVGKKGPNTGRYTDHYDKSRTSDSRTCSDSFVDKTNYIIRTKESLDDNAVFMDAIKVVTSNACVSRCCDEQDVVDDDGRSVSCDAAVFVDGEDAFQNKESNCFLFQCRFETGVRNRCRFSDHDGYISSMVGGFDVEPEFKDDPVDTEPQDEEDIPQTKAAAPATTRWKTDDQNTDDEEESECNSLQFQCSNGQCIRSTLLCDDYNDCDDDSDENPDNCIMEDESELDKVPPTNPPRSHTTNNEQRLNQPATTPNPSKDDTIFSELASQLHKEGAKQKQRGKYDGDEADNGDRGDWNQADDDDWDDGRDDDRPPSRHNNDDAWRSRNNGRPYGSDYDRPGGPRQRGRYQDNKPDTDYRDYQRRPVDNDVDEANDDDDRDLQRGKPYDSRYRGGEDRRPDGDKSLDDENNSNNKDTASVESENRDQQSKTQDDKWHNDDGGDGKEAVDASNGSGQEQGQETSRLKGEPLKEDWYGQHQPDKDKPPGGFSNKDYNNNNRNDYQDYFGNYYDRNGNRGNPNRFNNYRYPYGPGGDYQDYADYNRNQGNYRPGGGRGWGGGGGGRGRGNGGRNWNQVQNRYSEGGREEERPDADTSEEEDITEDRLQGEGNSADVPHSRRFRPGLMKIWRYMYGSSAADYTTEYPPVQPVGDDTDEEEQDDDGDDDDVDANDNDVQDDKEKLPTTGGIMNTKQGDGDITNKPMETQKMSSPAKSSSQDQSNNNNNTSKTADEKSSPSKVLPSGNRHTDDDVRVVDKQGVTATAVLPLTIGLFLTLFLLLMMSCRLRYMNRRLRYGRLKTNNAHDADYLINGMYL